MDLDRYYAHYPYADPNQNACTRVIFGKLVRHFEAFGLTSASKVLDYGCGEGQFLTYLRESGYHSVHGYDPYVKRFRDPSTLAQHFDVVTSFDVIEHVDDPRANLEELKSYVVPGGSLIVGTPNADGLSLARPSDPPVELHQPYHRHILSEKALVDLGRGLGLEVLGIRRRHYMDTAIPLTNSAFLWEYVRQVGGYVDAIGEPMRFRKVFTSPRLLWLGLFGYFFARRTWILVIFRKP